MLPAEWLRWYVATRAPHAVGRADGVRPQRAYPKPVAVVASASPEGTSSRLSARNDQLSVIFDVLGRPDEGTVKAARTEEVRTAHARAQRRHVVT